jgi:hypothetical protein
LLVAIYVHGGIGGDYFQHPLTKFPVASFCVWLRVRLRFRPSREPQLGMGELIFRYKALWRGSSGDGITIVL